MNEQTNKQPNNMSQRPDTGKWRRRISR